MNTKDRLMEWLLSGLDRLADWLTLGWWSRHHGEERIVILGDKE